MGKINIISGERRSREPAIGMERTKYDGSNDRSNKAITAGI